jgi:ubiquitin-conjugating enzyme E2 Z
MSASSALKRILKKDIREIDNQKLNDLGIYVKFNEENMLTAKAMITGPKDSLYEHAFLFFNIVFPKNYPYAPPDVSYVSRNNVRIHPNLYAGGHTNGGKVCLSILGTWSGPKWTSIMDITTILLTIQSLLDDNPLHHEPGLKRSENTNTLYNEIIKYESLNTLLLKNYTDGGELFVSFRENMDMEIKKFGYDKLIDYVKEFCSKNNDSKVVVPIYRINTILSYSLLSNNIGRLKHLK